MSDSAGGPPPVAPALPPGNPLYVLEHSLYVGNYISGIIYGVSLMMFFSIMRALLGRTVTRTSPKARRFFAIYSVIVFVMLTMDVAINAYWSEMCWINGRDHPGGVLGYIGENLAIWYQTLGGVTVIIMIFMGDALLIYRMYVIWGQKWQVVVLPILAYLTAFALSILQTVTAAVPGSASLFGGKAINFGVPYYAITIGLNILITAAIVYRLRRLSSTVSAALGRENAKMYTSVSAILIESAAPYSILGIMFLVPYATGSQTAIAFGQAWAKFTCVCQQMIVYRVVSGKAWQKETITQAESSVVFVGKRPGVSSGIELRAHGYSNGNTTLGGSVGEKWDGERSTKSLNTVNAV